MKYDRYTLFAGYNQWANKHIYAAAAGLSDADYNADRGAFFRSVHGTLNHILVADYFWMHRFTGEGSVPATLDAILYETLPDLTRARCSEDARIMSFVKTLTDEVLDANLSYTPITKPARVEHPLAPALDHFFNHQTHHRGQVHALLTGITGDAPSIDLMNYYRGHQVPNDQGSTRRSNFLLMPQNM